MPLGEDSTFAGYTIVRPLGAGGMGEVYLAKHPRLPRNDALKLLGNNVSADPNFRERFLPEADLACKLWHPLIVGVHDRGEFEGHLWFSMDFVDGDDAGSLIARRYSSGMPLDLVVAIVTAVGSALDYAHKQGLLHRDVKPANSLITNVYDAAESNGGEPLSQPESRIVFDTINRIAPELVIAAHAWDGREFVNFDGPARPIPGCP